MTRLIFVATVLAALCYINQAVPVPGQNEVNLQTYGFWDNWTEKIKKIKETWEIIKEEFKGWNNDVAKVRDEITEKVKQKSDEAKDAFDKFKQEIEELVRKKLISLEEAQQKLMEKKAEIIANLKDNFLELQKQFEQVGQKIIEISKIRMQKCLDELIALGKELFNWNKEGTPQPYGIMSGFGKFVKIPPQITADAIEIGQDMVSGSKKIFDDAVGGSTGGAIDIMDGFKLLAEELVRLNDDLWGINTIPQSMGMWDDIKEWGNNVKDNIKDWGNSIKDNIQNWGSEMKDKFLNAIVDFQGILNTIKERSSELSNKINDGLKAIQEKIWEEINKFEKESSDEINNIKDDLEKAAFEIQDELEEIIQ